MKIIIIGSGGFGREILDTINYINKLNYKYDIIGFVDNKLPKGTLVNGIEVLGDEDILENLQGISLIIGIGDPHARAKFFQKYNQKFVFETLIHPTAIVSEFSKIGSGTIIQAFCIVAANAEIGNAVSINARSGIGHDSRVGHYTSIQSFCDITGNNHVGEMCFLGTGVKLIPGLVISDECYLCAGSVVFKDLPFKSKVIGNPSKIIS